MAIDRKFKFVAVNPCNGKTYTEETAFIFCAKDLAVLPALIKYKEECIRLGCGGEHIEAISLMIVRVSEFQYQNEDICKIPDTDTDCEIDRCIGGNL